ncbi:MAG: 2-oxoglutarate ferredoxin oxidoreductase subunit alpha [Candidatus Terraquivivens tikiterensis]|uniref:2-oxoacid oxidoreductase (ferredoxin) n=1 Tax=Candidatus Terraquivivens tikiterensis TaxID=1980982 RepID=A0A2R7Y5P5_9ARCH|nr:MAG: 2-oxoglutarate ferredoxin oxidoreductase subunit alpha [Candidatus Terraquivivens tikiterensis]
MQLNRLVWRIGGAQGSGVDLAANVFARACAMGGLNVFGTREYYSNIKGMHSYFTVVTSDGQVRAHSNSVHLLSSFDAETVVRHALSVVPNGGIIFDPSVVEEDIKKIPTMEREYVKRVIKMLKSEGLGEGVKDVLELAKRRDVVQIPLPYLDLLKEISRLVAEPQLSLLMRMVNIMAVSAAFSLLGYDFELVSKSIEATFRERGKIAQMNVKAAEYVYDYVRQTYGNAMKISLSPRKSSEERILVSGTTSVALGKIAAGVRFQSYYPITPASDESVYLEDVEVFELRPEAEAESATMDKTGSIVVFQTEDEIAAIASATGAALTGTRAATATSGPGFSLMVEGLSWAGMNEVPVVVTLYQRGGPSTGLPTRHEQADLLFAMYGGHGEFPRIVLASGDIEEAFYDAVLAQNYAERYQLPVIHILDKALANSIMTCKKFDPSKVVIERGQFVTEKDVDGEYLRFKLTESGISPMARLGEKGTIFWNTGDEHDEYGHITEDPVLRDAMMEKRMKKLETAAREIPDEDKLKVFGDESAPNVVVSWGSPKGAILDSLDALREEGVDVCYVQVKMMRPFPTKTMERILSGAKKIVDVENNYSGQLGRVIKSELGIGPSHYVLKYNGRPIASEEAFHGIMSAVKKDKRRVVLRGGA